MSALASTVPSQIGDALALIVSAAVIAIGGGVWRMYLAVRDVKKEVLPNGGSSLRDAVNRVEYQQQVQGEQQAVQGKALNRHLKDVKNSKSKFDEMYEDYVARKAA